MTEEQADIIIELLKEIRDKLPTKTNYDLQDLNIAIEDVKTSVDKVADAIQDLDIS